MSIELTAKISVSAGLFMLIHGIRTANAASEQPQYMFEAIANIIERYAEDVKELEEELRECNASNLRSE